MIYYIESNRETDSIRRSPAGTAVWGRVLIRYKLGASLMELRELISFYHVARLRSVSKAARTWNLANRPSPLTWQLESEFGITLFDRIKRPIPTSPLRA